MAEQQDVHLIPAPDKTRAVVEDLLERQIDARDREIDRLVHDLHELSDEGTAMVEGAM